MKCPYCKDPMTKSKVADDTFYCWQCGIVLKQEPNGSTTIFLTIEEEETPS